MKLMNKFKISQVQFQASHIPALNAEILEKSFNKTLKFKPHLICTPECSNMITNDKNYFADMHPQIDCHNDLAWYLIDKAQWKV